MGVEKLALTVPPPEFLDSPSVELPDLVSGSSPSAFLLSLTPYNVLLRHPPKPPTEVPFSSHSPSATSKDGNE